MTGSRRTERLSSDAAGVARAAELLGEGELVAFPTETVYGLGAVADRGEAVARVFEAKGRPHFNPLIVHVGSIPEARAIGRFDERAERLAARFWPGPLTLVLPLVGGSGISSLVTVGQETVALRIPAHPTSLALLSAVRRPVAAPSANPSGRLSPTTADHVLAGLDGRIAAVLDGGPCDVGVESTIVGLAGAPTLLRPGGLAVEAIEAVLGVSLEEPATGGLPVAPGQLASHYAPRAAVRLDVTRPEPDETLLGFGDVEATYNLSRQGDLVEAAARLFDLLHRMDADGVERIAVSPIPAEGLGLAIRDRLTRAAAPRENPGPPS